jgi:hypothetical protein
MRRNSEREVVTVSATTAGSIRIDIARDGEIEISAASHPLRIATPGRGVLEIAWDGQGVRFIMGSSDISPRPGQDKPIELHLSPVVGRGTLSLNDSDAASACARWLDWRKKRYGTPSALAAAGRRLKSLTEQLDELARARDGLVLLVQLVRSGHLVMVGHVATSLRALLHWNGRSYNPLLLRLAGRFDLPLPLYIVPDGKQAWVDRGLESHVVNHSPSLIHAENKHELVDIQQWLISHAVTIGLGQDQTSEWTVQRVILGTATTRGSAHYDEDVPQELDALAGIITGGGDQVTRLIGNAATVTIPLCEYVLSEAKRRVATA